MGSKMYETFKDKYCMDERNGHTIWKYMCDNNEDLIRVYMWLRELVDMKDICIDRGNVVKLLNVFAQSNILMIKYAICIYFTFLVLF